MTKGIFTTKILSIYDDLPEFRYHFPSTYLNQVKECVGDWIVYYEPRRPSALSERVGGRQAYFATAKVSSIAPDPGGDGHYYAFVTDYLEFTNPVTFKDGDFFFESALKKSDGSTNKGAFRRAVRLLKEQEYDLILSAAFDISIIPSLNESTGAPRGLSEEETKFERPIIETIVNRPFRDQAFRKAVRSAYDSSCAMTGLRIINGGGRAEVQAAHIRPVADGGPDSVRNGIALSGTIHWMFDRGLLSVGDNYEILAANDRIPSGISELITRNRKLTLPANPDFAPHQEYLKYHRDKVFKG